MRHLLLTRPEPDSRAWQEQLQARGLRVSVDPLLSMTFEPPAVLDVANVQALIATSKNALRALGQPAGALALAQAKELPLFTVGPDTAQLAREMGFTRVHVGPAAARDLVGVIQKEARPQDGRLLHLSGETLAFDLAPALLDFVLDRVVVYRAAPATALKPETRVKLADSSIDIVVLLSPLTAKTFVSLVVADGLTQQVRRLDYVCLSAGVAVQLAPLASDKVHMAAAPNAHATFTLIETLVALRS